MNKKDEFNLQDFLPYLLNQAAEQSSLEFQHYYKEKYGMLRTEWRVLFHLGHYGDMTAKEICDRGKLHKTKVSRAVTALEQKKFISREELAVDRRHSIMALTKSGSQVFADLVRAAQEYNDRLLKQMPSKEQDVLFKLLKKIAEL